MTNSVVMIVPAQHAQTLNALGESMGFGPNTWNVPLSASGAEPATHYGTHTWEMTGSQFQGLRAAVQAGITPPGLEAYATDLASIIVRVSSVDAGAHTNWQAALTENGLQLIQPATSLIGE